VEVDEGLDESEGASSTKMGFLNHVEFEERAGRVGKLHKFILSW